MNAVEVVVGWRPQTFGARRARDVRDPIVEPLWSGLRFLGAVSGAQAFLQDVDGGRLDGFPLLAQALGAAVSSTDVIVDGYVTAELSHDETGTFTGDDPLDSKTRVMTQAILGSRPDNDDKRLDKGRAARMPKGDDPLALVLVDLLWLDGAPLLAIPLLERRRQLDSVLAESNLVRHGTYVRPPFGTWVGSWRSMGFPGLSLKSANSRYAPGSRAPDWASMAMPRR